MASDKTVSNNKGISRRRLLEGMAGTALAGVLAPALITGARAAGNYRLDLGGYAGPELTSTPVTLRFMRQDFTPAVNALIEEAYAEFTAAYPNITIAEEKVPYGDLQKKMLVYLASGDAPDIMMGRTDFSAGYHAGSVAVALQDYFTPEYIADIPENLREEASAGGNLYCVPWETNVLMLYFNRGIFENAGIQIPPEVADPEAGWEFDQFINTLMELKAKLAARGETQIWGLAASMQGNGGPGANYSQGESLWIRSHGDPNADKSSTAYRTWRGISEDGLTTAGYIDTPEAIEGIAKYQSLFSNGLAPLGPVPNQYTSGVAATYLASLNLSNRFRLPDQKPPFLWGVSAPPHGNIVFNCSSSDSPLVWSGSRHVPEAVALLAFLCNDKNRLAFHSKWGSMPSRISLRPRLPQYAEQPFQLAVKLAESSYSVPRTPGYFDYFNAMNPAIKDIALGANPAATLSDTAAKIDRLLAKYK